MFGKKDSDIEQKNSEVSINGADYDSNKIEEMLKSSAHKVKHKQKMRLKRRVKMILTAVISVTLTLATVCFVLRIDLTRLPQQLKIMRRMNRIDTIVSDNYIDDYDDGSAADLSAQGYVASLNDDYAAFYNESGVEDKKKHNEGEKLGIGITIVKNPDNGYVTVVYAESKGPATKAGIKTGDIILECNGLSGKEKSVSEISNSIYGKNGKENKLKLKRGEKIFEMSVKCDEYVADSVTYDVSGDYGIIKISSFVDTTYDQFMQCMKALKKLYVKGYIIDLRDNPGGMVDSCTDVLDEIVPKGELMRVKYKDGSVKVMAKSDDKYDDKPLCVLINGNTASAAEVMSSCIRDFNRGKIIGEKSFGKGIMQTTYSLPGKTAVKITTAKVINKDGESYHKKGIEPDIKVELTDEQREHLYLPGSDDPYIKAAVKYLDGIA